jgi:hypothetical protein
MVDALRELRTRQRLERLAAGAAYDIGAELVVVDELGRPYRPEHFSDMFRRLTQTAQVKPIKLHEVRHTTGTPMHLRGQPRGA